MYCFIAAFILFWIFLSERFTVEGILVGIVIALSVMCFNKASMGSFKQYRLISFKTFKFTVLYIVVLLKEILVANIHVAKIVLTREIKITPMFLRINTGIKSDLNKTIYANSITLTPGTITVMIEKDMLLVHCIDEKSAEGLKNPDFEKIIMEVEK